MTYLYSTINNLHSCTIGLSLPPPGIDVILVDGRRECLQEVVLENTIRVYSETWQKLGLRAEQLDEHKARLFLERSELGALVTQRCQAQIREFVEPRGASASACQQKGQQAGANSSKTKVSRVLQIFYRAGCFLVRPARAIARLVLFCLFDATPAHLVLALYSAVFSTCRSRSQRPRPARSRRRRAAAGS